MSTKLIDTNKEFFSAIFGGSEDRDATTEEGKNLTCTQRVKKYRKFASLDLNIKKDKLITRKVVYQLTDDYEFLENLGVGTYSYVKHAVEKKTGNHVAIKICRRKTSREMLKTEYNILKRIDNSTVVKAFDLIENDAKDESYMVMEYFEGTTLNRFVEEHGVLSEEEARHVFIQLAQCVKSLHEAGVSHRDLKPENLLIDQYNKVKLIDFNISKMVNSESVEAGDKSHKFTSVFLTQVSSPLYAAPEIKEQCVYSESIDIWGLGIVLFTTLFGTFEEHLLNRIISSQKRCKVLYDLINESQTVSDEMKHLLLTLLQQDPEQRPSASELCTYSCLA